MSDSLTQILDKLWFEKGYDFRGYKISSIKRRVTRRMGLNNIESYERYMSFLDSSPAEYHRLLYDLTIKVTGFFRDAYPFYILRDRVLPDIISSPPFKNPLCPPLLKGDIRGLMEDFRGKIYGRRKGKSGYGARGAQQARSLIPSACSFWRR